MRPLEILWEYREALLQGLLTTLALVGTALVLGTMLGILLQLITIRSKSLRIFIDVAAFSISTIPALVLLFWLYYPAQSLTGVTLAPFSTAAVALVVLNMLAVYRILADGVDEFPRQYLSSARVLGLRWGDTMRFVAIPLIVRAVLPRWIDQQVIMLQTSVFASLISVEEIFRVSQRINSRVYEPVTIYTAMALIFFVTAGGALLLAKYLRKKFHRDFSER